MSWPDSAVPGNDPLWRELETLRTIVEAVDAWDLARETWKDKDGNFSDPARVYRERMEPLLKARREGKR